jgi:hypothetical protein
MEFKIKIPVITNVGIKKQRLFTVIGVKKQLYIKIRNEIKNTDIINVLEVFTPNATAIVLEFVF